MTVGPFLLKGRRTPCRRAMLLFALVTVISASSQAETIEGFTEPYRVIHVASPESGILATLDIDEGDTVEQGQEVATLDSNVHRATLNVAEAAMVARGRLESAMAERDARRTRLDKLRALLARGHARQEEVDRAEADLAIAEGNLTAVQEELLEKRLEYERILVQLQRRTIRAPLDGAVTRIFKRPGEFVAPNDPAVAEIIQLNPLYATFMMTRDQARHLERLPEVKVELLESRRTVTGKVEFISPTIEPESGLVRVKIRLGNDDGDIACGQRCALQW